MPYGLGFKQSEINAKCRKETFRREYTQGKMPPKSFKLAGIKVLKQKSALNELHHPGPREESDPNISDKYTERLLPHRKETVVSINLLGTDTKIFGGEKIYFAWP